MFFYPIFRSVLFWDCKSVKSKCFRKCQNCAKEADNGCLTSRRLGIDLILVGRVKSRPPPSSFSGLSPVEDFRLAAREKLRYTCGPTPRVTPPLSARHSDRVRRLFFGYCLGILISDALAFARRYVPRCLKTCTNWRFFTLTGFLPK